MFQSVPERTSYTFSFLYLLIGIFFCIYPILGILKNDLVLIFRPGGKVYHLHGINTLFAGTGVILLGLSCLSAAIRNILEERQRQLNLYQIKKYTGISGAILVLRKASFFVFSIWFFYSVYLRII